MSDVNNVYAAMPKVTGTLFYAPLGTPLPTTPTEELDEAFIECGFIGEDGFTEDNTRDTTKKKAFGGTTVKTLQSEYTATIAFTFLESLNADVLRAVYGEDNVEVDDGVITVRKNKKMLPHMVWVIDTEDNDTDRRWLVGDGQITETGSVNIVHTDTIEYPVTIEAYESAALDGDNIRELIAPGSVSTEPTDPEDP